MRLSPFDILPWSCSSVKLTLMPLKQQKIIRGSLDAAFELTKVIKCSVFKIIGKKMKYSPKRKGAFSRLRKDNAAGKFGDKIL